MEYYSHLPNMASTFWLASWATDSEPIRARGIIRLFRNKKKSGAEMRPAIVDGIALGTRQSAISQFFPRP